MHLIHWKKKKIQHLPINHHTRKVWLGSVIRRIIINAPLKWKEVRNPPVALELSWHPEEYRPLRRLYKIKSQLPESLTKGLHKSAPNSVRSQQAKMRKSPTLGLAVLSPGTSSSWSLLLLLFWASWSIWIMCFNEWIIIRPLVLSDKETWSRCGSQGGGTQACFPPCFSPFREQSHEDGIWLSSLWNKKLIIFMSFK